MATQAARRAATRTRLIGAARGLFVDHGYEATSTAAILAAAGVSRGALYHHFPGKQELFAAVFEQVSREAIARAVAAARPGASPLATLVTSCLAWLREARRPEVAAILLTQGPRALGWQRAREIENGTSLALMQRGLQSAVDAGEIEVESVELAARLLNAVLAEAALASVGAEAGLPAGTVDRGIRRFIESLAPRTG
jgi:AcrR family transcriptional regulator